MLNLIFESSLHVQKFTKKLQKVMLCATLLQGAGPSFFACLLVEKKIIHVVVYSMYLFTRYMLFGTFQAVDILSLLLLWAFQSETEIFREGGRNQMSVLLMDFCFCRVSAIQQLGIDGK